MGRGNHILRWAFGSLCLCVLAAALCAAKPGGQSYTGRVLYKSNKAPVAGVLVEIVEAENDGRPSDDDALGSARADADGRFTVTLEEPTDKKVTLVVSAVRTSAESGGDRRGEGYEIKKHRTRLAYLPFPSASKPNTVLIERRRRAGTSGGDE